MPHGEIDPGKADDPGVSPRDRISAATRGIVDVASSAPVAVGAFLFVLAWLVVGFVNGFSLDWQAFLMLVSGGVTLVMVFLIQHATSRDMRAALLKLDALVEAVEGADERLMRAERRPLNEQEELEASMTEK